MLKHGLACVIAGTCLIKITSESKTESMEISTVKCLQRERSYASNKFTLMTKSEKEGSAYVLTIEIFERRRTYTKYTYIIQIMNGYECNGTDIFMRLEMECSIQRGKAELNRTFHL